MLVCMKLRLAAAQPDVSNALLCLLAAWGMRACRLSCRSMACRPPLLRCGCTGRLAALTRGWFELDKKGVQFGIVPSRARASLLSAAATVRIAVGVAATYLSILHSSAPPALLAAPAGGQRDRPLQAPRIMRALMYLT